MPQVTTTFLAYLVIALCALIVALAIWNARLESRISKFMKGKDAKSLEETVESVIKDINILRRYRTDATAYLETVENRLKGSVQCVETLRFNPFKGAGEGGNQSFATAFVNERGEGVVISSLHTRDRITVFAKPVREFSSEHELTEEERHVIQKAKERIV